VTAKAPHLCFQRPPEGPTEMQLNCQASLGKDSRNTATL
jgi:hypothetical protein